MTKANKSKRSNKNNKNNKKSKTLRASKKCVYTDEAKRIIKETRNLKKYSKKLNTDN